MGLLITFEGVEGAGKTTQIERSRDWLQHHFNNKIPIITTREPGGTILGQELRRLLLAITQPTIEPTTTTELLLYAADRAQHVEEMLKPELERGAIILCDRYTDSTIAYQGFGREIDLKLINSLNKIATGGLESHLTFWLDVEVEIGLKRAKERGKQSDRLESSDLAFHQRVRQGFAQLAAQNPHRIVKIDARPSASDVQIKIQQILRKFFRERE
ncbi:dTMP kinase [Spirulina sp. 06S082]|nr:dTMP kinase [Spirulina sp. 06S082]MEA5470530.1 dTMP kinase [Spirulina sp. 06S082]